MNIEQLIVQKLRELSHEKQREVLDFVEFLEHKFKPVQQHRSLEGIWADLGVNITEEDIAEARREMWETFSKEIEP